MATIHVRMRVDGDDELRRLAQRLRRASETELQAKLRRELLAAARPVLLQVRAAALGIYGGRTPGAGTRANTARVTRTRPNMAGVRFFVASSEMPEGREVMPGLYEGPDDWYHPTWGRPPYHRQSAHPWFEKTITRNEPTFFQGVERGADEWFAELGLL